MLGKFIVFEGADHCGKTTILNKISKEYDIIRTREPGSLLFNSSNHCEKIRDIILDNEYELTKLDEAYLFSTSRSIHTNEIIKLLKEGKNIISDRYMLSSLIYQGRQAVNMNEPICKMLYDNKIEVHNIIFSINKETFINRRTDKDNRDRIENNDMDYFDTIIDNYNNNIDKILFRITYPYDTIFINHYVDANKSIEDVEKQAKGIINKILEEEQYE